MRSGYAIMDSHEHGWLLTRTKVEGFQCPVTVWGEEEENAMQFRRLKDARAMLKVIRRDHRRPERVNILDPRWRVIV